MGQSSSTSKCTAPNASDVTDASCIIKLEHRTEQQKRWINTLQRRARAGEERKIEEEMKREINLKGKQVTLTYGRIGIENPASIIKKFKGKSASEDAKKFAESKIREKTNKGYIEK